MKKTVKILCILLVLGLAALLLTLTIGGRDIAAPDISDLMPEKQLIPEDQNAFGRLSAAAGAITLPSDFNIIVDYIEGKMIYDTLIAELLQKNEQAFPLIDQALALDQCQPPLLEEPAYIQQWYQIAVLLGVQAVHSRHVGQLSQSVHATVSLLRFGDLLHPNTQNIADFSPSLKILQLGLNQAGDLARTEAISKDDLLLLAKALAALKPLAPGLKRAFQFKFQKVAHQIDGFRASGKNVEQAFPDTSLMIYFIRKTTWFPAYIFKENETKQKLAGLYRDTIHNASLNYAEMKIYDLTDYFGLQKQSMWYYYCRPNVVGRIFYAFTTPEIDTYLEGKCQMDGSIRATQLIVALKLFEKENGKLPSQLDELCPTYLSSVPIDPFDGKPFRYNPAKGIVYSVSKDLKDSGGSTEVPPEEIYGPDYPKTWIAEDGVFRINP